MHGFGVMGSTYGFFECMFFVAAFMSTRYSICVRRSWFLYFEAYFGHTHGATFGMGDTSRFTTVFVRVISRTYLV